MPNRNGALTWIWGASCVPQVAFRAARPGRDRGWGWWQDSGHSRCRSSTRSPGAGGAPAGFCGTQRHISPIRFSTSNLQVQSDNTQRATLTCNSTRIQHYSTDACIESHIPHFLHLNWVSHPVPLVTSNSSFITSLCNTLLHRTVINQATACEQVASSVTSVRCEGT